jgi:hypothetical protein
MRRKQLKKRKINIELCTYLLYGLVVDEDNLLKRGLKIIIFC